MGANYFIQGPNDRLSWTHDWADFLGVGESISSRVWRIEPNDSPSTVLLEDLTTATVIVSGLVIGTVYELFEKITTNNNNVGEKSIVLRCEE